MAVNAALQGALQTFCKVVRRAANQRRGLDARQVPERGLAMSGRCALDGSVCAELTVPGAGSLGPDDPTAYIILRYRTPAGVDVAGKLFISAGNNRGGSWK